MSRNSYGINKNFVDDDNLLMLAYQRKQFLRPEDGCDYFFPPHAGKPPSDEAVHAATQRYIDKAKKET